MSNPLIVLPRPGTVESNETPQSIPAPSEAAIVAIFGSLLPPASYMNTQKGRVAYYELPHLAPPSGQTTPIQRVLFVHGVQTPAISLQPLSKILSSRFPHAQCVLVDLWGHGLTETPLVPHDAALFHWLLEALMAKLGWEDAHFIGYSFGASTTASFAAAKPQRVSSMALVAPAGLIRAAQFSELQRSYLRGGEGLEEQAQAWILELLEGGKLIVPEDWKERVKRGEVVAQAVRQWQMKEHRGHLASVVAMVRDGGVMDSHAGFAKAAKTGTPYLCILGELDDLYSVQDFDDVGMRNIAVVPQIGHTVVREKAPEVAQLIEDFWNKLE
ncbi:hypothetical protein FZEAL_5146 [Fusarium zealandicum]|uniref:AB hydrolase-1 domain-containing protein n=1 Tax=Fusarium zealandicum TaxID=1053134 RepID=A0A8H4XK20_9HYPO|nr:hypothetical protein FZEAL_5146 [Fusarium zealandicum]